MCFRWPSADGSVAGTLAAVRLWRLGTLRISELGAACRLERDLSAGAFFWPSDLPALGPSLG